MPKILKNIAIVLFIISPALSLAQGVRFKFYRTKACATNEKLDTSYVLYKADSLLNGSRYFPKNGTTHLPAPGRYRISFVGPLPDTILDIRDTGLYIYRFKEPEHGLYYTGAIDAPPAYFRCDSLLNGYQEYLYPNGNLEMRGTFAHGYPKDSIVTFYPDGKTRKRIVITSKWVIITEFDNLGNLVRIEHNQNRSFMEGWDYHWVIFYPGGKIKRRESFKKRGIKRIKSFYLNGRPEIVQGKNFRKEYYKNGLKSFACNWRHKSDYIIVREISYNENGIMTQKVVFEKWGHGIVQPNTDIRSSNWIDSAEKYKDGKTIFSASYMATKDFFKNYPHQLNENKKSDGIN